MAILDARSWECGNEWLAAVDRDGSHGDPDINTNATYIKTGSRSLIIGGLASGWGRWHFPSTQVYPSLSVWIKPKNIACMQYGPLYIEYQMDTGEYVGARWDTAASTLDAYVNGVKVADGSVAVATPDFFHVQMYMHADNSGALGIKINGQQCVDYSGDTLPGSSTGVDSFRIYCGASYREWYFDDMVWGNLGYLGDLRCVELRPDADTGQDDFTPSTGTDNYAMVDETPASDSDYNETSTDGDADELDLEDFTQPTLTPVAVLSWVRAQALTANGDGLYVGVDSGGTDSQELHALATAWDYYTHMDDQDPAGGEWDDAALDALKVRYEASIA